MSFKSYSTIYIRITPEVLAETCFEEKKMKEDKTLLKEGTIRRFMKLAGTAPLSESFLEEMPGGYKDDEDMGRQVKETGVLKIWKGGTDHPIFSRGENLKQRAVHDYMAHIQPFGGRGTGFDMKGEIQAYNSHLKTIPRGAAGALFTEVIGQASYFLNYGHFPEQKIALLPGFDYFNLGVVDGYDIINKELYKEEE